MAGEVPFDKDTSHENTLQSIRYSRGHLQLLDQRKLPHESVYSDIRDSTAGWHAIQDMVVRGAPAIAISAALSLAVEVTNLGSVDWKVDDAVAFLRRQLEYLVSSRPTAVNLSDAAKKLEDVVLNASAKASSPESIFQGSRLTAYELVHDHIPAVLIADSAAAALQKSGRVDAIVVGADRIAANGDTANKIGTYNLALSAFHHHIPFYVAAPLTSVDLSISSGEQIIIEERTPKELTHALGGQGQQVAPSGISVWNPAFDITPANLISAIITEKGIITKKDPTSAFDVKEFIESVP